MKKTQTLVTLGLLIALNVVLTRFLTINPTPYLRINFAFIAVAAASMLFGPVLGGTAAAISDVLGFFIFPSGTYFPGITVSALLAGVLYGVVLHGGRPSLARSVIASALVCLLIDAGLTTYWLTLLIPGKTFWVLFVPRLIKSLVMIPVESAVIYAFGRMLQKLRPHLSR